MTDLKTALAQATDTRVYDGSMGALDAIGARFRETFGTAAAVIVADERTWQVAGDTVSRRLTEDGVSVVAVERFPAQPPIAPDHTVAIRLAELIAGHPGAVPVAVGSGTINDLVKDAAHLSGRPYLVVATAASMDGYTSSGAAMIRDRYKVTVPGPAPRVVIADPAVLATAPPSMSASGFADLAGKRTAGIDWIVAELLDEEVRDPAIWEMVQPGLESWLADPAGVSRNDLPALSGLMEGLAMTGFAMQAMGDSRPASGSEHLFSHVWEMQHLAVDGVAVSHGFKVGIGSLCAAALMQLLFARSAAELPFGDALHAAPGPAERRAAVLERFGSGRAAETVAAVAVGKLRTRNEHQLFLQRVHDRWDAVRAEVRRLLPALVDLAGALAEAGCPVEPREIGLDRARVRETFSSAQMIRRRYTVLDLAFELGLLESLAEEVTLPGRFFRFD